MAEATAHKGSRLSQTFSSLRHPHYRRLWFTTMVNAGSNWLQQVTLGWLAYDTTDSALVAGLTFGLRALPSLIIGPIGGVLGDRFERKRGLQINSGYMMVLSLLFALQLAFGEIQTWQILLYTLLQGTGQALVQPVRQALVSNTVPREDLMNAIALNSFANTSMRVVGPSVAGALIALSGPAVNFGIQSAAYVLIFVLILPLKAPYTSDRVGLKDKSLMQDFKAGLAYVRGQPTLMGLVLMSLLPVLFTTPINLGLLPVFARDALHVDSAALGLLYSAQGVGAVLGTMALASFSNFRSKGLLLCMAAATPDGGHHAVLAGNDVPRGAAAAGGDDVLLHDLQHAEPDDPANDHAGRVPRPRHGPAAHVERPVAARRRSCSARWQSFTAYAWRSSRPACAR